MSKQRLKARKLKFKWSQYSAEYRQTMLEALNQLDDEKKAEEAAATAAKNPEETKTGEL